jgi:hypothetical protein
MTKQPLIENDEQVEELRNRWANIFGNKILYLNLLKV